MAETAARKRHTRDELNGIVPILRPEINALGGAIRGMGVGIPFDSDKPPIIFIDVAFPTPTVITDIRRILRDLPHRIVDVTRTDGQKAL